MESRYLLVGGLAENPCLRALEQHWYYFGREHYSLPLSMTSSQICLWVGGGLAICITVMPEVYVSTVCFFAADMFIWVDGNYFGLRDAHFQPCIVINGHFQCRQSINPDLYCDYFRWSIEHPVRLHILLYHSSLMVIPGSRMMWCWVVLINMWMSHLLSSPMVYVLWR